MMMMMNRSINAWWYDDAN